MSFARLLYVSVVRARCPCCWKGNLFRGWLEFEEACRVCGLRYEQWYGDWITPTYIAGTAGLMLGIASTVGMVAAGIGLSGPVPPELTVGAISVAAAALSLRHAKALWIAFLYHIGGVEVSAETRGRLRWATAEDDAVRERAREADARARTQRSRPGAPDGL